MLPPAPVPFPQYFKVEMLKHHPCRLYNTLSNKHTPAPAPSLQYFREQTRSHAPRSQSRGWFCVRTGWGHINGSCVPSLGRQAVHVFVCNFVFAVLYHIHTGWGHSNYSHVPSLGHKCVFAFLYFISHTHWDHLNCPLCPTSGPHVFVCIFVFWN